MPPPPPPASPTTLHAFHPVPLSHTILFSSRPYLHPPAPHLVSSLGFPLSSPLVARVHDYARSRLPPQTFAHSMRVFHFGLAIMRDQFPQHLQGFDTATLALACLLHDIATTPAEMRGTRLSFELRGAMTAMEVVLADGGGGGVGESEPGLETRKDRRAQAEAVAEAVARHQDLGEKGNITLLGQILQLATVYDNVSPNHDLIHPDTLADVVKHFPRKGWSGCFAATVREEVRLKPWSHTTSLGDGFAKGVEGNSFMQRYE